MRVTQFHFIARNYRRHPQAQHPEPSAPNNSSNPRRRRRLRRHTAPSMTQCDDQGLPRLTDTPQRPTQCARYLAAPAPLTPGLIEISSTSKMIVAPPLISGVEHNRAAPSYARRALAGAESVLDLNQPATGAGAEVGSRREHRPRSFRTATGTGHRSCPRGARSRYRSGPGLAIRSSR